MARYTGAVCKLCRREGTKLFLKGDRCYTKCPIDKPAGSIPPGQHGKRRTKITEFGKRLREKQKTKRIAGILEKSFYGYFDKARHLPGQTGENLLRLLETRLDNVVRRFGFASSMSAARQTISHGHVSVNGKRVNISSYLIKIGDRVTISDDLKGNVYLQRSVSNQIRRSFPTWLELEASLVEILSRAKDFPVDLNQAKLEGTVKAMPVRDEMSYPVNEQYIVELYSK